MTPKCPLINFKKRPLLFLENRHVLIPNHDSRKLRSFSKKQLFFAFHWSPMCRTLVFKCPLRAQIETKDLQEGGIIYFIYIILKQFSTIFSKLSYHLYHDQSADTYLLKP